jgi:ABC-2 type transport system ATP-binding protein
MIEVQGLTRRYGDFTAVEDVSFSVGSGQIVGMLGPNGAGKTTTIRMITGFLPPTQGRVSLAGIDLETKPVEARRQLGYLPENVALYPEMRVREYLSYRARLEGVRGRRAVEAIDRSVERCLLGEVRDQIIGTLSKGYRQRVGLATAILHDPEVLILDEPTVGLDPKQIIAIRDLIRDLGRERTLLLSTHILPEVELLCQRVMIIDRGRIIAQGTPESLRQQWLGRTVVTVTLKQGVADAADRLRALDGVLAVEAGASAPASADAVAGSAAPAGSGAVSASPTHVSLECAEGSDPREAVFRLAVERGWILLELKQSKASLEDIFVRLTTLEQDEDAAEGGAA